MHVIGLFLAAVLCLASAWGGRPPDGLSDAAVESVGLPTKDCHDPRVRTYMHPARVVWQSVPEKGFKERFHVTNATALVGAKRGQIPEAGWHVDSRGCMLSNEGLPAGILLDFGRELHGGLQIGFGLVEGMYGMRVRIRFGESVSEAMSELGEKGATNDHAIRDAEYLAPLYGTMEIGNTGFRFVRIDLVTTGAVSLEFVRAVSLMRPMKRLGEFRCSDARVNKIWKTAVRTVHLCCQDYLWDGIKRDRLVWMGDTHPEAMGILNVFGQQSVLSDSLDLMAAVTPTNNWMNNMGPYTLWWIRNVAEWYRFTGDRAFVEKHRQYLKDTFGHLASCLTPSNTLEGFERPFLDWPTEHNRAAVHSGLQGLALLTAREGVFLAEAVGDAELKDVAGRMAETLEKNRDRLDPCGSKQAAALLSLSTLREPREMFGRVLGCRGVEGVSTFYGYYMLEAMSKAGESQFALDTVRNYWGAMLDVGATSFWEDFNVAWTNNCFRIDELPVAGKTDVHGDYGEFCYPGFRHSLCHGWSCGPAAWLINHVLGIRPLKPGCTEVEVRPFLGDLEWAEGAMALPGGRAIKVRASRRADGTVYTDIEAPRDVKVVREFDSAKDDGHLMKGNL